MCRVVDEEAHIMACGFAPDDSVLVLVGDSGGFQGFMKVYSTESNR